MSSDYINTREKTREVYIKDLKFGGGEKVYLESMTKTKTEDLERTVKQILSLYSAGCEIVRVAVPDAGSLSVLPEIISQSPIPVIPDIHFDYRLALKSLDYDVGGIRINPGNIGSEDKVKEIIKKASDKNVHIRIGVNSGSLSKDILSKYRERTSEAMLESVRRMIDLFTRMEFHNIVVSLKSTDVLTTYRANILFSEKYDYPLHLGITEAGIGVEGISKSSAGIGLMLAKGLGNSIRVSLTAPPELEITIGKAILRSLGLYNKGVDFISCPTCGRCEVDLFSYAIEVKKRLGEIEKPITIAVMGCEVNGPGEAKDADVGIAFGKKQCLIFKKGEVKEKTDNTKGITLLMKYIEEWFDER
jgi:(E)-4-hydroxy-3-methylbut-2-enyl-diphosphate synthase